MYRILLPGGTKAAVESTRQLRSRCGGYLKERAQYIFENVQNIEMLQYRWPKCCDGGPATMGTKPLSAKCND